MEPKVLEQATELSKTAGGFTQQGALLVMGKKIEKPIDFGFTPEYSVFDLIADIVEMPYPCIGERHFAGLVTKYCFCRGILEPATYLSDWREYEAVTSSAILMLDEMELRIEEYLRNR